MTTQTSAFPTAARLLARAETQCVTDGEECNPYTICRALDHPELVCVLGWRTVHHAVRALVAGARPCGPRTPGIDMVAVGRMAVYCIVGEERMDGSIPESAPMLRRALECVVPLRDELAIYPVRNIASELVLVVGDLQELRPDVTVPAFTAAIAQTLDR